MAQVCGWVVLFRVILQFIHKWFFNFLPDKYQIFAPGFLELANGCLQLNNLSSDGMKFVWSAFMLGFGGICVYLQTQSIAGSLSLHLYLPGKILQGCISFLVAYGVQYIIYSGMRYVISPTIIVGVLFFAVLITVLLRNIEKPVAISCKILYNKKSCEKRRILCCSGKRSKNPVSTAPVVPN